VLNCVVQRYQNQGSVFAFLFGLCDVALDPAEYVYVLNEDSLFAVD
jgi:hypothetical protein